MDEQPDPQPSPAPPEATRRPVWVRRSVIVVAIIVAVLITVLLATGNHGPGRHVGVIVRPAVTGQLDGRGAFDAGQRDVEAMS